MTTDQYMVWRFRFTDGILDGIKSFNTYETVFEDGSKFEYNPTEEIVKIKMPPKSLFSLDTEISFSFKEFTREKIFSLGFKERKYNRHSCSEGPLNFIFQK